MRGFFQQEKKCIKGAQVNHRWLNQAFNLAEILIFTINI